jgi:hypothetical protein
MSRRSQVIQQRKALDHAPILSPTLAPPTHPVQLGLEQLAGLLMQQGAPRGWKLQTGTDPKLIRLIATCGPLEVPLDFTPDDARKLSQKILEAVESIDPTAAEEEPGPEHTTTTCTSCFREVVDRPPGFFTEQEAVEAAELENYFREQEQPAERFESTHLTSEDILGARQAGRPFTMDDYLKLHP